MVPLLASLLAAYAPLAPDATCDPEAFCAVPAPGEPVEYATPAVIDCAAGSIIPVLESLVGDCDASWLATHTAPGPRPPSLVPSRPRHPARPAATSFGASDPGRDAAPPPPKSGQQMALVAMPELPPLEGTPVAQPTDARPRPLPPERLDRPPRA